MKKLLTHISIFLFILSAGLFSFASHASAEISYDSTKYGILPIGDTYELLQKPNGTVGGGVIGIVKKVTATNGDFYFKNAEGYPISLTPIPASSISAIISIGGSSVALKDTSGNVTALDSAQTLSNKTIIYRDKAGNKYYRNSAGAWATAKPTEVIQNTPTGSLSYSNEYVIISHSDSYSLYLKASEGLDPSFVANLNKVTLQNGDFYFTNAEGYPINLDSIHASDISSITALGDSSGILKKTSGETINVTSQKLSNGTVIYRDLAGNKYYKNSSREWATAKPTEVVQNTPKGSQSYDSDQYVIISQSDSYSLYEKASEGLDPSFVTKLNKTTQQNGDFTFTDAEGFPIDLSPVPVSDIDAIGAIRDSSALLRRKSGENAVNLTLQKLSNGTTIYRDTAGNKYYRDSGGNWATAKPTEVIQNTPKGTVSYDSVDYAIIPLGGSYELIQKAGDSTEGGYIANLQKVTQQNGDFYFTNAEGYPVELSPILASTIDSIGSFGSAGIVLKDTAGIVTNLDSSQKLSNDTVIYRDTAGNKYYRDSQGNWATAKPTENINNTPTESTGTTDDTTTDQTTSSDQANIDCEGDTEALCGDQTTAEGGETVVRDNKAKVVSTTATLTLYIEGEVHSITGTLSPRGNSATFVSDTYKFEINNGRVNSVEKLPGTDEGDLWLQEASSLGQNIFVTGSTAKVPGVQIVASKSELDVAGVKNSDQVLASGTATTANSAAVKNAVGETQSPDDTSCGFPNFSLNGCLNFALQWIGNVVLAFFSWFLWLAGILLNYVLDKTLVNMKDSLDQISIIRVGWTYFRNLANMVFIFILLYISIGTVLQINGVTTKELLKKVIIYGLLLNFSLFFTNVIIDASNLLSVAFYRNITKDLPEGLSTWDGGLSAVVLENLKLQTIYDPGLASTGKAKSNPFSNVTQFFLLTVGGSIFMLITAFIFVVASVLFITRFVVLIFVMILSPLAFMASILPKTKKYADQWWDALLDQVQFAPAFMGLLAFSIQAIGAANHAGSSASQSFSSALTSGRPDSIGIIFNFGISIAFLLGTIVIAKQLGAKGLDGAKSIAGWATTGMAARVGKNISGRIADTQAMKNFADKNPRVGNFALNQLNGSMDLRNIPIIAGVTGKGNTNGYKKDREEADKARDAIRKTVMGGAEKDAESANGKFDGAKTVFDKANKEREDKEREAADFAGAIDTRKNARISEENESAKKPMKEAEERLKARKKELESANQIPVTDPNKKQKVDDAKKAVKTAEDALAEQESLRAHGEANAIEDAKTEKQSMMNALRPDIEAVSERAKKAKTDLDTATKEKENADNLVKIKRENFASNVEQRPIIGGKSAGLAKEKELEKIEKEVSNKNAELTNKEKEIETLTEKKNKETDDEKKTKLESDISTKKDERVQIQTELSAKNAELKTKTTEVKGARWNLPKRAAFYGKFTIGTARERERQAGTIRGGGPKKSAKDLFNDFVKETEGKAPEAKPPTT